MSNEHIDDFELIALVEQALDVAPSERETFIHRQTAGRPALTARALNMLTHIDSDDNGQAFTGRGLNKLLGFAMPERIGNYQILGEIGRGGMGIVYRARRVDADFEHEAAIKLVSLNNKSSSFMERLRSERRLLARLKHPNIAQFYDGGELENGAPFFIMELVDGVPLYRYLQMASPDFATRLALFEQICGAISYAHTNTIVHRDLSPGNILINKSGIVKVIDFGISSSLSDKRQNHGADTLHTAGYSAPERREGAPANTLADIYSLGVILSDIVKLRPHPLSAECDAIIAKASHPDPEQRYTSVDAMRNDIRNMLNHRPVTAMAGGATYRMRCFIRANRVAVTAGAVLLTGILTSAIVFASLYFRAITAETYAQARFNEVRNLAGFMMFDHYDNVSDLPGSIKARAELANKAQTYLNQLSQLDNAPFELKVETASGFRRLADVLGNPMVPNLGRRADAEAILSDTLKKLMVLQKQQPEFPPLVIALAETHNSLSVFSFIVLDDTTAAYEHGRQAEEYYRQYIALTGPSDDIWIRVSAAMRAQSNALVWAQQGEKAAVIARQALKIIEQRLADNPTSQALQKEQSNALTALGYNMTLHADNLGVTDYDEAVQIMEEGIKVARRIIASGTQNRRFEALLALNLLRLGTVYYSMDKEQNAIAFLDEARTVVQTLLELDPHDKELARRMNSILKQSSVTYAYLSNFPRAVALSDQYIENQLRLIEAEPGNSGYQRELANGYGMRAEVAYLQQSSEFACEWYKKADEQYEYVIQRFDINPQTMVTERRFIFDGLARCQKQK